MGFIPRKRRGRTRITKITELGSNCLDLKEENFNSGHKKGSS